MALKVSTLCLVTSFFGILGFLLAIIAENKKPAAGIPFGKDVVTCKFPKDPTIALGVLSFVSLVFSTLLGLISVFYPYGGVSVPKKVLFKSTSLSVFFLMATLVTIFGGAMLLWATITEALHHINNVHHIPGYECPTAKTGLFGAAAFLVFDAMLFWLISVMLTCNARDDHVEGDPKGEYGEVLTTDYEEKGPKGINP